MLPAEDIVQILNLCARYVQTIDHGEIDDWVECFAPDGMIIRPHSNSSIGVQSALIRGHSALAEFGRRAYASEGKGLRRRWTGNSEISAGASRDEAIGRSSMVAFVAGQNGNPPTPVGTGEYLDRFTRTKTGWRFAVRAIMIDGGVANPDVEAAYREFAGSTPTSNAHAAVRT